MIRLAIIFIFLFIFPVAGKTLTIVTQSSVDSAAVNAKILSKYLIKYLPDTSGVIFKEVPGADGIVAANYLYNVAPKDGNTIGIFTRNVIFAGAYGGDAVKFDVDKFSWLGSSSDGRKDAMLLFSNKLYDGSIVIGTNSDGVSNPTSFIKKNLDWNIREVTGYRNTNDIRLAMERKEVDAMTNGYIGMKTSRPYFLTKESGVLVLLQFGNGSKRHPDFPYVPTLYDLAKDKDLVEAFEKQFIIARPFVAPPGVPESRLTDLRKAFRSAVEDREFFEEARASRIDVDLITWEETEQIIGEIRSVPRDKLEAIR